MTPDASAELANYWNDVAGRHPNLGNAYTALRRAARNLLPDDIAAVGAAVIDDVPTALALGGAELFLVRAVAGDDGQSTTVTMTRLPVAADRITVELTDGLAGGTESQPALLRHWKFTWPDERSVEFDAVAHFYGGWGDGPDSAELLARALADIVGWKLPSYDS
jgi:hypothetical protein